MWLLCLSLIQIRELEPVLCQTNHTSRVVWTSSSNARRSAFRLADMQHRLGTEPYSSSKYASDLLSLALNRHKNTQVTVTLQPTNHWCYPSAMVSLQSDSA